MALDIRKQPELLAEELRYACVSLGRLTGAVEPDDLLDNIFSNFCIGK
jgi:tRNA modification GTPase